MSDKAFLSGTERLVLRRQNTEVGRGGNLNQHLYSLKNNCVSQTIFYSTNHFWSVSDFIHLIKRQQSGSASQHAYYYVYIQHMHYLHEGKKKKIHKHSIVRPSFNPRLCTVHASHGMHGIIQQLCNEARVFFSPPTLLNSLLIPVVALWRRVAWCAIPFIKARKTSFCNPGYVNSPSHSSLSLRV